MRACRRAGRHHVRPPGGLRHHAVVVSLVAFLIPLAAVAAAADRTQYSDTGFSVTIDNPTVKVGTTAVIVATISPQDGFRITPSYRHRLTNLSATGEGVTVPKQLVRGVQKDGGVVFNVDVVPKVAGAHTITGVFRFSINDGERLDIKATKFQAVVHATE